MKKDLVKSIKSILSNGQPMKLINIYNKIVDEGDVTSPNTYMSTYLALRENIHLFEKVSKGYYKIRDEKETKAFLQLKKDPEEALDEIYDFVSKNPNKTPTAIHQAINNSGTYISYKSVCHHLRKNCFTSKLDKVKINKYTSVYSTEE